MYNGGVSRGRSVAVGLSDRWKVTCDMWHVTSDIWHLTSDIWLVTCDTWFYFYKKGQKSHKKGQKCKEMAKKCPKVQKTVKKAGFHSIRTIRRCRESWCLPYAGFFTLHTAFYELYTINCTFPIVDCTRYAGTSLYTLLTTHCPTMQREQTSPTIVRSTVVLISILY